ncbi:MULTISPECIES: FAD-dependent oxidoreductase [unclassified Streptomyces]|uniref:FAD-dependent oxidoreductase n=1 Tax=unclassified Streptomyces TaxID=2593676 RepID=UPI003805ECAA
MTEKQHRHTSYDADVIVVGAGPVGLTLALDLARRGMAVRVLERDRGTFEGSRAKGVQPRTLEVFDDLGVIDAARAAGGPYPPMGLHVGPFTKSWQMQRPAPAAATPYPGILLLPQYATTALLYAAAVVHGAAIEFGTPVEQCVQDADAATVGTTDGRLLRARYVVGADGGSSLVRKSIGAAFEGNTDEADRMIIADARIDGLSRDRWHVWPRTGGRSTAACPLPSGDLFQLMIPIRPDDPADLSEEALAALLRRRAGRSLRLHGLTWASVFRPNIRLATRYRRGRLLICGDAAHVHTPAGAQGLNTGVQDAYNLGWKLHQVLAGAPDTLLDSYEGERRPVAAKVLGRSTELYAGLKRPAVRALSRGDDERQLGLSYFGGPLAPLAGQVTDALRPGDRAPDAPAPDGARLFDLYRGPQFTALAFGHHAAETLAALPWPTTGAALHRHTLLKTVTARTPDEEALLSAYGITTDTLVLVRPDGYIGHVLRPDAAPAPGHDLLDALQRLAPPRHTV